MLEKELYKGLPTMKIPDLMELDNQINAPESPKGFIISLIDSIEP